MTESSLHREWVSILSKCVYAKFHQIDYVISHDNAKKQAFFGKYWQTNALRELRGREGEREI